MATVKFEGMDDYVQMLAKLGNESDRIFKEMVKAGLRVVYLKVRSASAKFAKYAKAKAPKKNQYGWFAQVQFRGRTGSGAPAGLVLSVYEHGRSAGEKNGHKYPAQPARPWLDAACASAEGEAVEAMQKVFDEEAAKLGSH